MLRIEAALVLSVLVHLMLMLAIGLLCENADDATMAQLNVKSLELSLGDEDKQADEPFSEPSTPARHESAESHVPELDAFSPVAHDEKAAESVPDAPNESEIATLGEPVLKMEVLVSPAEKRDAVPGESPKVDSPAELVNPIRLVYPRSSRRRGEEGRVQVRALVDASGRVSEVKVVRSSGFAALDEAVLKALGSASFSPASRNGENVRTEAIMSFEFRLK